MNKNILIGSIIAVVILVLVTFTGVVGYQTTSTTIARASPLFNMRISRAIDEECRDLTCDYVGKGEETNIHLSRMNKEEHAQKVIDIISKMDDKAFSKFVGRIILRLKNKEQMSDTETSEAVQILYNIRQNPNVMKYYYMKNNPISDTSEYLTCRWFPGCYIFKQITWILTGIIIPILIFIFILYTFLNPTCFVTCRYMPHFCPPYNP